MTALPTLFVSHGGGPLPLLGDPSHATLVKHFKSLPGLVGAAIKTIVVISAHYEEKVPTVLINDKRPLLYDYGGFPPESYKVQYPCPGSRSTGERIKELLQGAGLTCKEETVRGLDHGAFVPLKVAWPAADIPTIQLSLVSSLDPALHLRIGAALRPLRSEGVLLLASGFSFHNMSGFFGGAGASDKRSKLFDDYLVDACTNPAHLAAAGGGGGENRRAELLREWAKAPHARYCHPREEHLIPLMVVAGAAGDEPGHHIFSDSTSMPGISMSSFLFGEPAK